MLPPEVKTGIALINQGAYFEAHEVLEEAWRATSAPIRDLYQGLLQAAVVAYHIQRQNWRGAFKVYLRAMRHLEPWPPTVQGIPVEQVRDQLRALARRLQGILQGEAPDPWPQPLLHIPLSDASETSP